MFSEIQLNGETAERAAQLRVIVDLAIEFSLLFCIKCLQTSRGVGRTRLGGAIPASSHFVTMGGIITPAPGPAPSLRETASPGVQRQ